MITYRCHQQRCKYAVNCYCYYSFARNLLLLFLSRFSVCGVRRIVALFFFYHKIVGEFVALVIFSLRLRTASLHFHSHSVVSLVIMIKVFYEKTKRKKQKQNRSVYRFGRLWKNLSTKRNVVLTKRSWFLWEMWQVASGSVALMALVVVRFQLRRKRKEHERIRPSFYVGLEFHRRSRKRISSNDGGQDVGRFSNKTLSIQLNGMHLILRRHLRISKHPTLYYIIRVRRTSSADSMLQFTWVEVDKVAALGADGWPHFMLVRCFSSLKLTVN